MITKKYEALMEQVKQASAHINPAESVVIQVGSATCENAGGAQDVLAEFKKSIATSGRDDIHIREVGCTGRCSLEPIVSIFMPNEHMVTYQEVTPAKAHEIFVDHVQKGQVKHDYVLECEKTALSSAQAKLAEETATKAFYKAYGDKPFYCKQARIALRNAGIISPLSLSEYMTYGGFKSLADVLEKNNPEWIIDEMKKSMLRGRGGGGFPTGVKWSFARNNEEQKRYMICNADEGDPGAFMDRSMLESDPFSVVEGMIIAGFAIGAQKGYFYIRAEYPLAVERIQKAIDICRENGLVGENILGSEFSFDLEIRLGAGAFVCGEETALIHSIEGKRGQPRVRPPFPAVKGLWGKPTIINNVETLASVPAVIALGGEKFKSVGTDKSGGTKVFALAGKVNHTGLVEVPMGTTLREIVYDIGGGVPNGKKLKAVQTGGPAGGFIPASMIDTPVDYDTLMELGSIMGSGGMIVLDEDDCMVDVAKFYLTFTQDESCGKCTPCREGTKRMLEILERITSGQGTLEDLDKLERLGELAQKASLCGLGRAAPNPILSGLRNFREEFEAHVLQKRCPAKKCVNLIHYEINPDKCVGCTACARVCPVNCIEGERKSAHKIDQSTCIKCGACYNVCRFDAVDRV